MKKNNFIKKPDFIRLFFLFLFVSQTIYFYAEEPEDIFEHIKGNFQFSYVKLFFRKEVKTIDGERVGLISGKIEVNEDETNAYIIMNDTSYEYKYANGILEESRGGSKVSRKKMAEIPMSINVTAAFNPISSIKGTSEISVEGNSIKAFWKEDILKDSAFFYFSDRSVPESVKVFKGEKIAIRTEYKYNNDDFPLSIITFDYSRGIIEYLFNYNISYQRIIKE